MKSYREHTILPSLVKGQGRDILPRILKGQTCVDEGRNEVNDEWF